MSEETVEVTIKTTPKGLQEMMASMPGLAAVMQSAAAVDSDVPATQTTDVPLEPKEQ